MVNPDKFKKLVKKITNLNSKSFEQNCIASYIDGYIDALYLPQMPSDNALPKQYCNYNYVEFHAGENQENTWEIYKKICPDKECDCGFKVYNLLERLQTAINDMQPEIPTEMTTVENAIVFKFKCDKIRKLKYELIDLTLWIMRKRFESDYTNCLLHLIVDKRNSFNESCKNIAKEYKCTDSLELSPNLDLINDSCQYENTCNYNYN